MRPDKVIFLGVYSGSLLVMHNLLKHHYFDVCKASLLSVFWNDSRYCVFIDSMMKMVSAMPLAAIPFVSQNGFFSKNKIFENSSDEEKE